MCSMLASPFAQAGAPGSMSAGSVDSSSAALVTDAAAALTAGKTLYVDGKIGSDTNTGTSPTTALKTIAKATMKIPAKSAAAGWTVVVQGYKDYIYRERPIPAGWGGSGTSSAPVTFQAAGYVPSRSSYVKPIVSGSELAPSAGQSWQATNTPGVWRTPWATTPNGYGSSFGPLTNALFEDGTKWLWAQRSLSDLAVPASKGQGGFWYDAAGKYLYASGISSNGPSGASPVGHTIDVIERGAFYFSGANGVRYVAVRGFQVEHSANGIAFSAGTDYGTAADNVTNANLYMGIVTVGIQTTSGPDPAVGNVVWRNSGSYNTIQAIKAAEGTQNSSFCYNDASANGYQGIKIEGPAAGSSYTGTTSGNTISHNTLHGQTYNPTGSVYNGANGLTVANGAINTTVSYNDVYGNDVGIKITQEYTGMRALSGTSLSHNRMWSNRRFGLHFFDGAKGSGAGNVVSSYDLIWANGLGVMVDVGSINKSLVHDTIYANTGDGVRVGGVNSGAAISISSTILSSNGGYGVLLVAGNRAPTSYSDFYGNTKAPTSGSPALSHVNYNSPGFISTTQTAAAFLQISTSSYQYTAGPSVAPIGAKY
jgi:hypothetical protein